MSNIFCFSSSISIKNADYQRIKCRCFSLENVRIRLLGAFAFGSKFLQGQLILFARFTFPWRIKTFSGNLLYVKRAFQCFEDIWQHRELPERDDSVRARRKGQDLHVWPSWQLLKCEKYSKISISFLRREKEDRLTEWYTGEFPSCGRNLCWRLESYFLLRW